MESFLSTAFDNIASTDTAKVRKGLRQVDALLVQICFSQQSSCARPMYSQSPPESTILRTHATIDALNALGELANDRAYQHFHHLQQSFEWNICTKLVECLGRLLGRATGPTTDALVVSALESTLCSLILHAPSRSLFGREINMNLLIDLLDPVNQPRIILCAVDVITASILDRPQNIRVFENTEGLQTMVLLYQSSSISTDARKRIEEFLSVYLMPESVPKSDIEHQNAIRLPAPVRSGAAFSKSQPLTKTISEKQMFLSEYLGDLPAALRS